RHAKKDGWMMNSNQKKTPLYDALKQFADSSPVSFHVPGHENGRIFPDQAREHFGSLLPLDLTELSGLDDLHALNGMINKAQEMAADFFGANHTHFLVVGSIARNLALILSICSTRNILCV